MWSKYDVFTGCILQTFKIVCEDKLPISDITDAYCSANCHFSGRFPSIFENLIRLSLPTMSAGSNPFNLLQLLQYELYMSLTDFFVIYALLFYFGQCACVPIIVFIDQSNLSFLKTSITSCMHLWQFAYKF